MNKKFNITFDVVIVGGGLVGASLGCALAQADSNLNIAIIESHPFSAGSDYQPAFDARSVAISYTSRQVFEAMELWSLIDKHAIAPIKDIHVSDRGHAGVTRLNASSENVEALGYVIETRAIGQALFKQISKQKNISLFAPAVLKTFSTQADQASVSIESNGETIQLSTSLIVAADGGNSSVRKLANIPSKQKDYSQVAVIANVVMDRPHHNIAYERFTDSGPLALLPMSAVDPAAPSCRYSLVWTTQSEQLEQVMQWDNETFMQRLQQRFGNRAGKFIQVSQRHTYPLELMQVQEHVRERLAIIGNAAHTLHPVAGQGFNLGLRDVAALSQVIIDARRDGRDFGQLEELNKYAQWRSRDHRQTAMATDSLVKLFSNNYLPVAALRNLGLLVVDTIPPLKSLFARHAMGFVGKLPRLGRGLKL